MLPEKHDKRKTLLGWARSALAAVDPCKAVASAMHEIPSGDIALLAIGKAALGMHEGAQRVIGSRIVRALLVASELPRQGGASPEILRGDHPLPGDASLAAGDRLIGWLQDLPPRMPLLVLLSGGGSALVEAPVAGIDRNNLRRLNEWLLASGLSIHEMNNLRARFSRLKRGGLARLAGERHVTGLIISDVPNDCVEDVASGPLSAAPFTWPTRPLPGWLEEMHRRADLPPADALPNRPDLRVVASNRDALDAVIAQVRVSGPACAAPQPLAGEAAAAGCAIGRQLRGSEPGVSVFGGETTVVLPAKAGRGGRNQHLALAAAMELQGMENVALLALATDGIDGNTTDAGALVDGGSVQRMQEAGIDAARALREAESNSALAAAGDLVNTGPTGTNVSDIVIAWKW